MNDIERAQMSEIPSRKNKHGALPFVLAGLSLVPLVGVLFGIACILIAAIGRKSNSILLASIGAGGILVTVILYGVILPNKFNDPKFAKSFESIARSSMTSLVRDIEYFKLQSSRYPRNLEELKSNFKKGELVVTDDFSAPGKFGEQKEFYYKLVNNGKNYLLLGVGPDGKPITDDDIYPELDPEKDKAVGWVQKE